MLDLFRNAWRHATWLLGIAALLAACGGGVDSGGTGSYAVGPITGYGSIIVGGVHYDETSAEVRDDDGTLRTPADLQIGMVTEINASDLMGPDGMPSATATAVRFRSELVGAVEAVDPLLGTIKLLGQTVKIGATTVFDARLTGGLTAVHVNDVIEVYGQLDVFARRYTATRIEPRSGATQFKLRGLVVSVNATSKTLVIGGQTIDYRAVASTFQPAAGQLVRVALGTTKVGGNWVAAAIEIGTRQLPDRDNVKVEGRVTVFNSVESFEVDGIPVATDAATAFPDGRAGVVLGARVEAHGSSRGGLLIATRIAIEGDDFGGSEPFELNGTIRSLDAAAQTFVLRGFTVHWSDTTRFDRGNAGSLRDGREAEVKGALSADGTRLEASFIHAEL
jgi:hypothetical protein